MKLLSKQHQDGIAAVEFALMAPLLMAILLGVLEFGIYFTKYFTVQRAVANISVAVQSDPNNPDLQAMATNSNLSMVNFSQSPNYFCAQTYENYNAALSGMCNGGFNTSRPITLADGQPYYIALVGYVHQTPLTALFGFLPDIRVTTIVRSSGVASSESPIIGYKAQIQNPVSGVANKQLLNGSTTGPIVVNGTEITYTPVSDSSKIMMEFKFFAATTNIDLAKHWGVQGQPNNCNTCYTMVSSGDGQTYVDWRWITPSWGTTPRTISLSAIPVLGASWPTKLGVSARVNTHGFIEITMPASVVITEFRE